LTLAGSTHVEEAIEQILARLTWPQKLAQLQIAYRPRFEDAAALVRDGIGAVFWPGNAERTAELQRIAREETPHGIPLLIGLDVVHGQYTIFPTPLAQAASFDPEVAETDARVSAGEAASSGVNWTFSPMIDVSPDLRWGRIVEGFGEDPWLTSLFGAAKVRGYQGDLGPASLLACAKHYVGYGLAEAGRDYNTVDASEYRLRNGALEPFRVAVEAGAASVMASFNTVAGRPMHAHRHYLTDVLKDEWGHGGIVVGDADGVVQLVPHGVAADASDAVALAFGAGLDVEMGGHVVVEGQPTVTPEQVDADRVDDAVRRVLRVKFARGLFDSTAAATPEVRAPTAETRAAARAAATRCPVLLTNDGTLPIRRDTSVLLVGPYAESTDHLGAWTQSFAAPARSLGDALRDALPDGRLTVLPGAGFFRPDEAAREAAVRAAREHDVVIVAVGEPSSLSGEATSRADPRLPGDQAELVRAIAATGVPFAVVLVTGRPLVVSDWIEAAPSVLLAWHLGTEGPEALADLLLGVVSPAGRLPVSIPRAVGQIPSPYNAENTGRPPRVRGHLERQVADVALVGPGDVDDHYSSKYLDLDLGPEFAFGHGLSYSRFEYGEPRITSPAVARADLDRGVTVEVEVTNVGAVQADEVVQLYVHDVVASLAPPVRRLRGARRIAVAPGESRVVAFRLTGADLGFWDDGVPARFVVEPGEFDVHLGGSLISARPVRLTVTP
jgi:beta-glucosidase